MHSIMTGSKIVAGSQSVKFMTPNFVVAVSVLLPVLLSCWLKYAISVHFFVEDVVELLGAMTDVLSCQPRVTVTLCFVYNVIGDL